MNDGKSNEKIYDQIISLIKDQSFGGFDVKKHVYNKLLELGYSDILPDNYYNGILSQIILNEKFLSQTPLITLPAEYDAIKIQAEEVVQNIIEEKARRNYKSSYERRRAKRRG